jgi:hypothetical protein
LGKKSCKKGKENVLKFGRKMY